MRVIHNNKILIIWGAGWSIKLFLTCLHSVSDVVFFQLFFEFINMGCGKGRCNDNSRMARRFKLGRNLFPWFKTFTYFPLPILGWLGDRKHGSIGIYSIIIQSFPHFLFYTHYFTKLPSDQAKFPLSSRNKLDEAVISIVGKKIPSHIIHFSGNFVTEFYYITLKRMRNWLFWNQLKLFFYDIKIYIWILSSWIHNNNSVIHSSQFYSQLNL